MRRKTKTANHLVDHNLLKKKENGTQDKKNPFTRSKKSNKNSEPNEVNGVSSLRKNEKEVNFDKEIDVENGMLPEIHDVVKNCCVTLTNCKPLLENENAVDEFSKVESKSKNSKVGSQKKLNKKHETVAKDIEISDEMEVTAHAGKNIKTVPNQTGKGSKRKRGNKSEDNGGKKPTKTPKKEKDSDDNKGPEDKIPDVTGKNFSNDSKSPSGNTWNFKISSWNVNGIRAWLQKSGLSYLHNENPDVICVQETKCSDDKLPEEIKKLDGYHCYWVSGDKDGYSGVGILSKLEPLKVDYGIGIAEHDNEGRVITVEFEKFYLVAAYVPNAGRKLVRLEYRQKWDKDFCAYLKQLDAKKPVILCGDLNVAHEEIDLANPKTNKRNAGFTIEEREGFSALLGEGFLDTFRHLYPDAKGAYTFWTYMMNARAKNVGWRLDYFVMSERFAENLCDSVIRSDVLGSDHCPVTLFLHI